MKKAFITGGTGFIGSHLVKRLSDEGYSIKLLVRASNRAKIEEITNKGIELVQGDIRDCTTLKNAMNDVDVVFHLAGLVSDWGDPELFNDVNINGTKNVCQAALESHIKLLIYISTNDVFGYGEDKIFTENDPYCCWNEPYPDSKIKATRIVKDYEKKGLPVSIIYPCWVYGPGDTTFITPMAEALKSKIFMFWRKNALVWPLYIDNLIDLLMAMATNPNAIGKGFIAHDGISVTFEEFTAKLSHYLGLKFSRKYIPYKLAYAFGFSMEVLWKLLHIKSRPLLTTYSVKNLGSKWRFSIKNAQDTLNWNPTYTYEKGIENTMKWFNDHT
ncbi:MAG: SDR family NAD(P)-dependent oxidoreductase [Proteobacteria bacterium]|nr:SDR family NAD(P)-dependent oxidoreductase [Pseudomonadota bacterium]